MKNYAQDPGSRRTPAQIQTLSEVADDFGQLTRTWTTVATIWCLKRSLYGYETVTANQTKAIASCVLETWHPRSLVTITPDTTRLLINGEKHWVSWLNDVDGAGETLLIYCTTVTPDTDA